MTADVEFWRGRRVLVTGHTGFKGAWLCMWLGRLGAKVTALSLPPDTDPNLYTLAAPWPDQDHHIADIRDTSVIGELVARATPEIVFHMAAQPIVRASYRDPADTFTTNVIGTVNLLEAIRRQPSVKAAVVVTSDKVYENHGEGKAFIETDRLGGADPYSASKACAELVARSYRSSFFSQGRGPALATARAGNVVGGGDWAQDRLVPDIIRAVSAGEAIVLRYPKAVRPWQHVLDALSGYLLLAEHLITAPSATPAAVNFGPDPSAFLTVAEMVAAIGQALDSPHGWTASPGPHPSEAPHLTLDSSVARAALGWAQNLSVEETVAWTADWYRAWRRGGDIRELTERQIAAYEDKATKA